MEIASLDREHSYILSIVYQLLWKKDSKFIRCLCSVSGGDTLGRGRKLHPSTTKSVAPGPGHQPPLDVPSERRMVCDPSGVQGLLTGNAARTAGALASRRPAHAIRTGAA